MKQSPSWKGSSSPATQETPSILWNPKVHYRFQYQTSPGPHLTFWKFILIVFSHLRLGLISGLLPSSFPTIRATCPVHLILLDLISRTLLGEQYRSQSFSLCSLLHVRVTSCVLGPNTFTNTLFSNTLSICSSLNVRDKVPYPYKTTSKITVLLILSCIPGRW